MRSEWTLLDFKPGDGVTDLKQTFARNVAARQEGLVLKPLHAPYFPLLTDQGHRQASFFIKLKKDYLGDMGGERDLGDFAVIGVTSSLYTGHISILDAVPTNEPSDARMRSRSSRSWLL
jgi:DNA ligase-4